MSCKYVPQFSSFQMQTDGEKYIRNQKTRFLSDLPELIQPHSQCLWLLIQIHSDVMFSAFMYSTFSVQTLNKLYSVQLNCTCTIYTGALATCSPAQEHSTFTVQILYKLYILQLTCNYSNYTDSAATCSAAQQHSTFTVQILYKLYILQLNCNYSN